MKLLNFTIIKLVLAFAIGIALSNIIKFNLNLSIGSCICLLIVLVFTYYASKRYNRCSIVFGIIALVIVGFIGYINVNIKNESLNKAHYTNQKLKTDNNYECIIRISERLKSNIYSDRFVVDLVKVNSTKVKGKLLMSISKEAFPSKISIDDVFLVSAALSEISKPKNPFQFNYNAYLKQRQIYHQIYVNNNRLLQLPCNTNTLKGFADKLRQTINDKLILKGFKDHARSVINALLLGQRQDISEETYNNYKNSGTIHILAISGLHVGIIYFILIYVFSPLERLRYGKTIFVPVLVLLLLWSYAFIAGLSPSVTRATTMFSIVAIAKYLKRPTNIYNTLCISAFILLLFQPRFLFDVGFQMSYLAVFAIVSIQPLLYHLWQPKWYILDKPWQILTVTIAAQLGVAPISVYYFHQFPGLFFVSNLVVIPFLGILLGFGLLIIVLALLNILPNSIANAFSFVIETLNQFIAWVAQFERFLFKDIPFNIYQVITLYMVIFGCVLFWKQKTYQKLRFLLIGVLLFSLTLIHTKYKNTHDEFVIFNSNKKTLLAEKSNSQVTLFYNNDTLTKGQLSIVRDYKVGNSIKALEKDSLHNVYRIGSKTLLVIDSTAAYNVKGFTPSYVLLSQSPKINLKRLIKTLHPEKIIADASNYKSYVERWKITCKTEDTPFYSTYEKGALIFKGNDDD